MAEMKLVVWKDENKWLWQIENAKGKIRGRNTSGLADTFRAAYDAARKRLAHERRKDGDDKEG